MDGPHMGEEYVTGKGSMSIFFLPYIIHLCLATRSIGIGGLNGLGFCGSNLSALGEETKRKEEFFGCCSLFTFPLSELFMLCAL